MANPIASLFVQIGADVTDLKKGLSQAESLTSKAGEALKFAAGAAAVGFGALAAGIGVSVKAAAEAEKVDAQLAAVLKSTKGIAGVTADEINRMADALSNVTPFEDDVIKSGQSMLLTFTNIGKKVFPDATEVMLDMSQALGQDLKSSALQLGKALNNPIEGVGALRRVGVQFTDAQEKQIKTLVESGRVMDAQKFILAELKTEFGGAAKAAGGTFAGQMQILSNQFGNIQETIGTAFIPALKDLATWVSTNIIPAFKKWAEESVPQIIAAIKNTTSTILQWWTDIQPRLADFRDWFDNEGIPALQEFYNKLQELSPYADKWLQLIGDLRTGVDDLRTASEGLDLQLGALGGRFDFIGGTIENFRVMVDNAFASVNAAQSAVAAAMRGDWINAIDAIVAAALYAWENTPFGMMARAAKGIGTGLGNFVGEQLSGRANGGNVNANTPYVVGERGAELFVPRQSGTIVPSGARGGVTVNINAPVYGVADLQAAIRGALDRADRGLAY